MFCCSAVQEMESSEQEVLVPVSQQASLGTCCQRPMMHLPSALMKMSFSFLLVLIFSTHSFFCISLSLSLLFVPCRPQCLLERARFHHLQFPVIVLYWASRAPPGPWRYLGKRWNVKSQPFLSVSGNPSQTPQPQTGPPMNSDLQNEAQGKRLVRLHRRPQ